LLTDPEVIVDELVAHTCDLSPENSRIKYPRFIGDSLADDLDVADDCILRLAVGKEGVSPICRVAQDRVDCFVRVKQIDALVFHNGTASA
jgi:hypothetical protein